jgi:hypothetical protein
MVYTDKPRVDIHSKLFNHRVSIHTYTHIDTCARAHTQTLIREPYMYIF